MRIDSATVGMESARSYRTSELSVRRFVITEYQQALAQSQNGLSASVMGDQEQSEYNAASANEAVDEAEDSRIAMFHDWQNRFGITNNRVSAHTMRDNTIDDLRQLTIRYIFDMLFAARRSRFRQWMEEQGFADSSAYTNDQSSQMATQSNYTGQPQALNLTIKTLNFVQEDYHLETEDTSFSTVGTVRTTDGREINFNVEVGMSRTFQEYYREDLEMASFTMCDPLVINLDTDVAALEDQKFYFDIDADGEVDEVASLGAGSGYLALDKNNDGVINDGSELFGTESGNGFADLAKYDSDGNGWIDEADEIWDKLKIWCKDENGQDVLYKLGEKGVGAICLQNVATDFSLRGNDGQQTLGAIRNSGIFLYENGNVGTIQHVDVAKYSMEA
ncbi:MAG: hypothetical protein IJ833_06505 [Lachnospiraceae bacterium]|nr:hypothetical protein [Lachnospiraceae bacterium]